MKETNRKQKNRETEEQRNRGTEGQRNKKTEEQRNGKVLFVCFCGFLFLCLFLFPSYAFAADWLIKIAPPDIVKGGPLSDLQSALNLIFNIIVGIASAVFFLLLITGGVKYMVSLGNEEETNRAKRWLLDAVIGLVLVAVSWAAGNWLINKLTGQGTGGGSSPQAPTQQQQQQPGGGIPQDLNLPEKPPKEDKDSNPPGDLFDFPTPSPV